MKNRGRASVFAILCVLLLCIDASAHSGGTDSKGGHYNHSTGEYHYHHGHPAHQHPNGICPYGDYYIVSTTTATTKATTTTAEPPVELQKPAHSVLALPTKTPGPPKLTTTHRDMTPSKAATTATTATATATATAKPATASGKAATTTSIPSTTKATYTASATSSVTAYSARSSSTYAAAQLPNQTQYDITTAVVAIGTVLALVAGVFILIALGAFK